MDDKDLFSYDNSNNLSDNDSLSFDLNNFSSKKANLHEKEGKSKKKHKKWTKQRVIRMVLTCFLVGLITCSIVVATFLMYAFTMVDGTMEENLDDLTLNFTTTIYEADSSGNYVEYQRLHGVHNRIWVPYDRVAIENNDKTYTGIPQNLVNAFVAIEDKRFFSHNGVDWKRTFAAFANMFLHFYSSNQGGSTITQQLVKNLTGDTSQKPSRKIREIMRARYFESKYSKDTIIECYLNTIAMGHGTYGVEVAANYYFGKSVDELNLTECACLASITKSPTYYAPDTNPEANKKRRNTVLYEMKQQGYITDAEYEEAIKVELEILASKESLNEAEINSYFVDALIDQVVSDIADKYGYDKTHASKLFYSSGYKIYSTIDSKIQTAMESVMSDSKTYGIVGKDGKTMQGSMTLMDYSGHVKALVGGIGEKTANRGFNRATDAVRQPGSTMKPIGAYALAIENDMMTYSTIVNDTKTSYHNNWSPVNWYKSYWGNITIQYALERSVNTIPVYIVNKLSPQTSYDFLTKKLGITTLTNEDINLSPLGMGGTNGGLTTIESAAAYAIFGNLGVYYSPTLYTKVLDQHDNVILEYKDESKMAISEDTATVMNRLLQTVVYGSNGTGTAAKSYVPNMKIYAKTGTSNDQNDLWFVGGTPYYVASCWCGYDTQQPIPSKNSGIALKIWGNVMSKVHSGLEAKEFTDSVYAVKKHYCLETGLLATDTCTSTSVGWYRKGNIPEICTSHAGTSLDVIVERKEAEEAAAAAEAEALAAATNAQDSSTASE